MKFMNLKRLGSVAMAGAMALSLAAPAFAANESVITGSYKEIRLAVTVPSTGKAVINPYGLPIALSDNYNLTGQGISNAAPLTIQNRSAVPLKVNASITGTVPTGSNFAFETGNALNANENGKKGLVKFEMFHALGLTETTLENEDVLIGGFAALDSADALPAGGKQIKGTAGTPDVATNILTLREGTADGNLQAGGAAYFRLTGEAVKAPATPWAATDTFVATIAFTFEPSATPFAMSAGTLAADTSATTSNEPVNAITTTGATIVLTSALPDSLTPSTGTNGNTVWSVDNDDFSITPNSTDPLKAVVKAKTTASPATGDNVNITVTITDDSNGISYTATVAGQAG